MMAKAQDRQQGKGHKTRRMAAAVLAGAMLIPALATGFSVAAGPAAAQNLFAPRLYVNGQVITEYEVIQRALFMKLLNAPGDLQKEALKELIDDRLRLQEAKRLGVTATDQEILDGMTEFASRANLTAEQLIAELQKIGIAAETYRDFVTAGLLWRKIVQARYAGRVPISEADVDKALDEATRPRALKVLVSELVIPAEPGKEIQAMELASQLAQSITSEAAFAAAARKYSAAPTAGSGGRVAQWLALSNLPGPIAQQILVLGPGQVSAPVQVPNAIVLFQLRQIARDETAEPISVKVEWAEMYLPDDAAELARIKAGTDTCNDLNGFARGLPAEALTLHEGTAAETPRDVGLELARLDIGEFATARTATGNLRLIMLCARAPVMEPEPSRDQIKQQIVNQRIEGLAERYLEELRSAALLREP
ncbi:MAG: peptidylprolyl isomerase [Rhodobacteraceae bacterium]|nr:peptidylprolyl isomerase [Paracoccaceae bacterium]